MRAASRGAGAEVRGPGSLRVTQASGLQTLSWEPAGRHGPRPENRPAGGVNLRMGDDLRAGELFRGHTHQSACHRLAAAKDFAGNGGDGNLAIHV